MNAFLLHDLQNQGLGQGVSIVTHLQAFGLFSQCLLLEIEFHIERIQTSIITDCGLGYRRCLTDVSSYHDREILSVSHAAGSCISRLLTENCIQISPTPTAMT